MKQLSFHIVFCLLIFQHLPAMDSIEEMIAEGYFSESDTDVEILAELLDYYQQNPLKWKVCSIQEIRELPLNSFLIETLVNIKRANQPLPKNKKEWREQEISSQDAAIILYFFDTKIKASVSGEIKSYISVGHDDGKAAFQKMMHKGAISRNSTTLKFVADHDKNEPNIVDYSNLSVSTNILGHDGQLIAGAFIAHWGQGLVLSARSMQFLSDRAVGNLKPVSAKIRSYSSTNENRFLMGAAVSKKIGKYEFLAYASRHNLDAYQDEDSTWHLTNSGYHISQTQIDRKNSLAENSLATGITRSSKNKTFGILVNKNQYSGHLDDINSNQQFLVSGFHSIDTDHLCFSGETAAENQQKFATVQSVKYFQKNVAAGLGFRYYSPGFYTRLSQAAKSLSSSDNEAGIYYGLEFQVQKIRFSAYYDYFRMLMADEDGSKTAGNEFMAAASRKFTKIPDLYFRYKRKISFPVTAYNDAETRHQFYVKANRKISKTMDSAFKLTHIKINYQDQSVSGMAVNVATAFYIHTNHKLTAGITETFSDDYTSRIYIVEPGIPGHFNMTAFYGSGQSFQLVYSYECPTGLRLDWGFRKISTFSAETTLPENRYRMDFQLVVDL